MVNQDKIVVLHIAGTGRNGSTLLERILNEVPGFFAAGEIGFINLDGVKNNRYACSCGKKYNDCPAWGMIKKEECFEKMDTRFLFEAKKKYMNTRRLLKLLRLKNQNFPEDFTQYLYNLSLFYKAVKNNQTCQVITDSTCNVAHDYYLSLVPEIDLHVVHLVRDPRGVAHSWSIPKYWPNSNKIFLEKRSPWRSAVSWMKRNLFIEFYLLKGKKKKYLRVHYEDLIEKPTETVEQIRNMLGLNLDPLNFIDGKKVKLSSTHLLVGNISVFLAEETVLKLDERWKHEMKWTNVFLVTLITWPLMLKYFLAKKMKKKSV